MRENKLMQSLRKTPEKKVIDEKGLDTYLKQVSADSGAAGRVRKEKVHAKVLSISAYPEDRAVLNNLKRFLEDSLEKNVSVSQVYRAALYAAGADEKLLEAYRKLIEQE